LSVIFALFSIVVVDFNIRKTFSISTQYALTVNVNEIHDITYLHGPLFTQTEVSEYVAILYAMIGSTFVPISVRAIIGWDFLWAIYVPGVNLHDFDLVRIFAWLSDRARSAHEKNTITREYPHFKTLPQ